MEPLTENEYKTIISRRDARFDGRFYFGVKTTHIYCRPVCPARPKPENIVIFKSISEAENRGYRACLRCRPDRAPGSQHGMGTANTVSRALRIIHNADSAPLSVPKLAQTLGVTDRHLRRLFEEHLGASPLDILSTQRLHFARQMILETPLPVGRIALVAGFRSVRQFNEAFQNKFHSTPSKLRTGSNQTTGDILKLKIPVRLPYDWESVLRYLRRHEVYGLEHVDTVYTRYIVNGQQIGKVVVSHNSHGSALDVQFHNVSLAQLRSVLVRLKLLFDTEHNPVHLPQQPHLAPRGIRVPGHFDAFETTVSIVLSQLVSTEQAKLKLKKLIEHFGEAVGVCDGKAVYRFPSPEALSNAPLEELGMPRVRAQAIRQVALAVATGTVSFGPFSDAAASLRALAAIKGIGPWTIAMIAMRCLNDPDAFPASDLIVQRALEQKLVDASDWRLSRAYLTHCLWRDFSETLTKQRKKKQ